jgi:hypothetical protein
MRDLNVARQDLVYFENIDLISNKRAGVMLVLLLQGNNSYKSWMYVYIHRCENVYHGKHTFMSQQGGARSRQDLKNNLTRVGM